MKRAACWSDQNRTKQNKISNKTWRLGLDVKIKEVKPVISLIWLVKSHFADIRTKVKSQGCFRLFILYKSRFSDQASCFEQSLAAAGFQRLLGRDIVLVAVQVYVCGFITWFLFDVKHVPLIGQEAFAEDDGGQPWEQDDGHEGGDHDEGAEREVLGQLPFLVQAAAGEPDDGWEAEEGLSTQDPEDKAQDVAQCGSVTVRGFKKENADQLRKHDCVGHVHANDPEDKDAAVQEGKTGPSQAHHHHRDPDHPLHLRVWSL